MPSARTNRAKLVSTPSDAERALINGLGHWSAGEGPLYQRLAAALRNALDRDIPAGRRLPPERRLAELLLVSRTTVVAAYNVLRDEGRLESRRGSGTRVAAPIRPADGDHRSVLASLSVFRSLVERESRAIDLSAAGLGSEGIFSSDLLERAGVELAECAAATGYEPYGLTGLREAVARHLSDAALPTKASQILITNGAQQAINLVARLFVAPGSRVLVENPTYAGAIDAFIAAGARLHGIAVDEQPSSVGFIEEAVRLERPRLLYLMPTFQNPTGAVSTLARRRALAALAADHAVALVEDNTLAPLAIDQTPPPPIGAFDADGRVITIGSLSKTVWAGLRIGWIRADVTLIDRLVRLKTVADLGSSVASQVLARLLLEDFARIERLRAEQLGHCLELACALLATRLPAWSVNRPRGGQSLWIRLPQGDAESFAQAALRRRVTVVPGPLLSPDRSFADHIRLQFLQPAEVIEEGIKRLARAWREYGTSYRGNLGVVV
jgi:DNA-binding transcriptional MocR family regulator